MTISKPAAIESLRLNVKLERKRYQPKGGMCMTCKKWADDCSELHFESMPIIGTTATRQVIVRCTEHVRSNVELSGRI